MDMLGNSPLFELENKAWPIHPSGYEGPATKILKGNIHNSIIAEGGLIERAKIKNSFIRADVVIENNVSIEDSIIMEHVVLKKGCRLKRVIIDKMNVISEGEQIGFDTAKDRFRCHVDSSGIAIVPRGGKMIKR
jgi:glucose-1-phosphate adenylyltransferase